jgi:hypothetical protein
MTPSSPCNKLPGSRLVVLFPRRGKYPAKPGDGGEAPVEVGRQRRVLRCFRESSTAASPPSPACGGYFPLRGKKTTELMMFWGFLILSVLTLVYTLIIYWKRFR